VLTILAMSIAVELAVRWVETAAVSCVQVVTVLIELGEFKSSN
jgi:hypothetical protein